MATIGFILGFAMSSILAIGSYYLTGSLTVDFCVGLVCGSTLPFLGASILGKW